MIPIIGDWIEGLKDAFMPGKATGSWSTGVALGKYYKRMIIPFIITLIVEAWIVTSSSTAALLGSISANLVLELTFAGLVGGFLIFWPIIIVILGIVYHIFGQMVGAVTKNSLGASVSAAMHSVMPYVSLYFIWQLIFWFLGRSGDVFLIFAAAIILLIWMVLVLVFSFAAVHKTTKGKAFLTWLVPFVILVIVVIVYGVAFANLIATISPLLGSGLGGSPVI